VSTVNPIELTAEIVSAFVSNNSVPPGELSALIQTVHAAVTRLADGGESSAPPPVEAQTPAVSIRKSVTPDYLICLDDGKKFKSLKRRLAIARPNGFAEQAAGSRVAGTRISVVTSALDCSGSFMES
jgi:predicted transcriptional regulator